MAARELLVDDAHLRCAAGILQRERSAATKRHAQHLEITGADYLIVRARPIRLIGRRVADDLERLATDGARERDVGANRRGPHTWRRGHCIGYRLKIAGQFTLRPDS